MEYCLPFSLLNTDFVRVERFKTILTCISDLVRTYAYLVKSSSLNLTCKKMTKIKTICSTAKNKHVI